MKAAHGQADSADTRLGIAVPDNEDEFIVPDTETAVLIAAAKTDSAYQPNSPDAEPKYEECIEVSADAVSKKKNIHEFMSSLFTYICFCCSLTWKPFTTRKS